MRQVVVDTETTGLEVEAGHRILEVGCVEIIDRRLTGQHLHHYINPEREIDDGALEVHNITRDFLRDKPKFAEIWEEFLDFVQGSELIIHNAPFDLGFLNYEMSLISPDLGKLKDYCQVVDSLELARSKHPGQKNNLDSLCKRYNVDNSQRELHGALLDAELLAEVYLLLTGGQEGLGLDEAAPAVAQAIQGISKDRPALKVIKASDEEVKMHNQRLDQLDKSSADGSLWRQLKLG